MAESVSHLAAQEEATDKAEMTSIMTIHVDGLPLEAAALALTIDLQAKRSLGKTATLATKTTAGGKRKFQVPA